MKKPVKIKTAAICYFNPNSCFKKGEAKTIFCVCGMENFRYPSKRRTYGWYSKFGKAIEAVQDNRGELWEYCYDYIVVEEVKEGVWGLAVKEWWFKWNRRSKKYRSINKPNATKGTVNWSIG